MDIDIPWETIDIVLFGGGVLSIGISIFALKVSLPQKPPGGLVEMLGRLLEGDGTWGVTSPVTLIICVWSGESGGTFYPRLTTSTVRFVFTKWSDDR